MGVPALCQKRFSLLQPRISVASLSETIVLRDLDENTTGREAYKQVRLLAS